jgi:hypothetical protein
LDAVAIGGLLESFATAALGLELKGSVRDLSIYLRGWSVSNACNQHPTVLGAWHTDRGGVTLSAVYDEAQSRRLNAHVMKIAWWIGAEHHDGWWHCYPRFPRDWIKGIGRP